MKQGILFGATAIAFGVLVSLLSFVLLPFCSGHGLTTICAYDIILLVAGELQRKTSAFVGA